MKKLYTLLSLVLFSFAANAQCSDLFISEYVEGGSYRKAIEIYNPTNSAVDMSAYEILLVGNGGSFQDTFSMSGTIASNDVFVIMNSEADLPMRILGDTILPSQYPVSSVVSFNGDDVLLLLNAATRDTIDKFGIIGPDPGSSWPIGSGSTKDRTIRRKASVNSGVVIWNTAEWEVFPKDDYSDLGSYASDCHPSVATEPTTAAADPTADAVDVISIYSQSYTDPAGINYYPGWGQNTQYADFAIGMDSMIRYSALNYQGIDFNASEVDASSMEMLHIDIWTADVADIDIFPISRASGEKAVKKTLTAGQWNSIDIPLSEYTSQGLSMSDIFQFKFDNLGASRDVGTIFIDNMYMWKEPTLVYNVADIADIVGLDADFSPVNLDTLYEVTGIVYGIDYQGGDDLTNTNAAFTLIDATDGVGVFARGLDYVVKEGDEVTVKGTLDFFRGLTQIAADSITVVSSGNAINDPTDVTSLSEATESDLVRFTKVWLADTSDKTWPSGNIDLTNGTDTFAVRIDSDTKGIAGKTIEFDTMNIVGLGGQFDGSAPHNEGYQLFPRDSSDITEWVNMISVRNVSIQTSVYPNPTSNNLTVVGATKWESFVVYSILGGEMAAGTLNNNNLSVANLNNGTYIIKLVAGEQVGVARFVVSK